MRSQGVSQASSLTPPPPRCAPMPERCRTPASRRRRWGRPRAPALGAVRPAPSSTTGCRQKCRPILADTSNMTNLYAHVVKGLSPRNCPSLAVTASRASDAAWYATSSSSGPLIASSGPRRAASRRAIRSSRSCSRASAASRPGPRAHKPRVVRIHRCQNQDGTGPLALALWLQPRAESSSARQTSPMSTIPMRPASLTTGRWRKCPVTIDSAAS